MSAKSLKKTTSTKQASATTTSSRLRLRHWVIFWTLVAATYATITTIFSHVDLKVFLPDDIPHEEAQMSGDELINELKTELMNMSDKVQSFEKSDLDKHRYLVSMGATLKNCPMALSSSTQDIVYLNTAEPSVTFSLPYSFSWGNEQYAINPIDRNRTPETLYFGPGVIDSCCVLTRDSSFAITKQQPPLIEFRKAILAKYGSKLSNLGERVVNGIPVLSYEIAQGDSIERVWVGYGRTNYYTLTSKGWLTDAEAIKIIQSLRVTK